VNATEMTVLSGFGQINGLGPLGVKNYKSYAFIHAVRLKIWKSHKFHFCEFLLIIENNKNERIK